MFFRKRGAVKELAEEKPWEMPTSMIDVVFLLLIFFLCSSNFRVLERRLDAMLPGGGDGPPPPPPIEEELFLKVDAPGPSGRVPRFRIRGWVAHDPNELAALLMRLPRPGKYRIVIDGEASCPFRHMVSAMDACARAGQRNVSFTPPPAAEG